MTLTLPSLLDRMAAQEAERVRAQQASGPRQEDCAICGLVGAGCFGFGVLCRRRGIWACQDLECRTEARARSGMPDHQLVAAE
ncbi:hypothetical protein FHR71_004031 [Methylobacterium sp. RAS18]|nr:hypothetical protein [Methylobacterium sp. RAS18]